MSQSQQNNLIPSDINALYTVRLALMLETGPQTNEYRQLRLTQEQYRELSAQIGKYFGMDEDGFVDFQVEKLRVKMPEGIKDYT